MSTPRVAAKHATEYDIDVHCRIPNEQYKVIYQAALTNDTSVARLVAELIRRGLGVPVGKVKPVPVVNQRRKPRPTPDMLNNLVTAHGRGLTDQAIASAIRMSLSYVEKHRRKLGLSQNVTHTRKPKPIEKRA